MKDSYPKEEYKSPKKYYDKILIVLSLAILLFSGCTANYGNRRIDPNIVESFETGQIYPDYNYYYSGRDSLPYAIIGIDKTYTVNSSNWTRFEASQARISKMADSLFEGRPITGIYGFHILDQKENKIGVWYSNIYLFSTKIDPEKHTISVLFTNPEI